MTRGPKNRSRAADSDRGRWLFAALGLTLLTILVFAPVRHFDFISLDDPLYVRDNAMVTGGLSIAGIGWAFTSTSVSLWQPLVWLSYMAECQAGGADPAVHHVTNLALHLANGLLLLLALSMLGAPPGRSLAVAALFAIHPLHVESVAWITERKDVLGTFFAFLALVAHLSWIRTPTVSRRLAAVIAFALALMSKSVWVGFPLLLLLLDYWPLGRLERPGPLRLVVEKIPFFLLSVASAFATLAAAFSQDIVAPLGVHPLPERVGNAVLSIGRYVGLSFFPRNLAVFYPLEASIPRGPLFVAIVFFGAATLVSILLAKRFPYLIVGWAWFLVALAPVLGIVQVGTQSMADRFTYVPLVGLSIAVVWGGADLVGERPQRRRVGSAIALAAILFLAFAARRQVDVWESSETLFRHAARVAPGNPVAETHLAEALERRGAFEEALGHRRAAVEAEPGNFEERNSLCVLLRKLGRLDEAAGCYREAIALAPERSAIHYNYALALEAQGRADLARREYRMVLRADPVWAMAQNNIGTIAFESGRVEEAVAFFERAVAANPDFADAQGNLGGALLQLDRVEAAVSAFRRAARLEPGRAQFPFFVGLGEERLGRFEEATAAFAEAIRIDPAHEGARRHLAGLTDRRRGQDAMAAPRR